MEIQNDISYENTKWRKLWKYKMTLVMEIQNDISYGNTKWHYLWKYKMTLVMEIQSGISYKGQDLYARQKIPASKLFFAFQYDQISKVKQLLPT